MQTALRARAFVIMHQYITFLFIKIFLIIFVIAIIIVIIILNGLT